MNPINLSSLTYLPLVAWGLITLLWANLAHYESKEVIRNLNVFSPKIWTLKTRFGLFGPKPFGKTLQTIS